MQNKHQSISKAHNKGKQFENKENVKLISTKNIINNRNASLLSQQYLILRPFGSILLERDPPDNSSFSLVNPKICFKPYLTETTILDIVLPKVNIFSNFFKEIYEENYKNCDSLKEPTILLNGERVRINEKCIFEEVECKKSDFFERKYVSENFGLTDFEIGKPLGKGRFGTVFLVKHKLTNTIYAMKMVNKQLAMEENVYHLIKREAMIQESLVHPNILKCFGSFEDEKRFYLILEYTPDGDLYVNLKKQEKQKFKEKDASQIIFQLLSALVYLKSEDILHRDIKAENIMNSMGTYKLSDFGWAVRNPENLPRKTFCGTIEYVAPEMILNENYTESIDLWAVAVLTYELVMGKPPFQCISNIDTFLLIADVKFDMPEFFSDELKDFLKKMMVKNYLERMRLNDAVRHPFISKHFSKKEENFFN